MDSKVSQRQMDSKSASALTWFALIVNFLGLTVTALGMQFVFSAFAVVLTLIPTIFARKGSQIFGGAVLVASIALSVAGFPEYKRFADEYGSRARVSSAITFIGTGRGALESACLDGKFGSKQKLADVGLPESHLSASISRVEFLRVAPNAVHLKATFSEVYGTAFFGLFQWVTIRQGSTLEFEFICSPEKKFTSKLVSSTIERKYLPASLRNQ